MIIVFGPCSTNIISRYIYTVCRDLERRKRFVRSALRKRKNTKKELKSPTLRRRTTDDGKED